MPWFLRCAVMFMGMAEHGEEELFAAWHLSAVSVSQASLGVGKEGDGKVKEEPQQRGKRKAVTPPLRADTKKVLLFPPSFDLLLAAPSVVKPSLQNVVPSHELPL